MTAVRIVLDVVSAALLLFGSGLTLVAAIGLHRLQDLYARLHVATKPATLGIASILAGALLQVDDWEDRTKLLLALVLQLLTAPVSGHLLGRSSRSLFRPFPPSEQPDR